MEKRGLLFLAIIGLIIGSAAGYQFFEHQSQERIHHSYTSPGWQALSAGEFEQAAQVFRDYIAKDPDNPYAHEGLAWTLLSMSQERGAWDPRYNEWFSHYAEAERSFQRAIELNPTRELQMGLVSLYQQQAKSLTDESEVRALYTEIDRILESTLESDPKNSRANVLLAWNQIFKSLQLEEEALNTSQAISLFETSLENDPQWEAYHGLGYTYAQQNDFDEAIEYYELAAELNPASPGVRSGKGYTLFNLESQRGAEANYSAARVSFREAIELDPAYYAARNGLGLIAEQEGNHTAAISHFERSLETRDNLQAHNGLALAHSSLGEYGIAEDHARKALEMQPDNARTRTILGRAYLQQGELDLAEEEYRSIEDDSMVEQYTSYGLGTIAYKRGDYDEALTQYQRFAEVEPENAYPFYLLGLTRLKDGSLGQAKDQLETSVDLLPTPAAYILLAHIAEQEGDETAAEQMISLARQNIPLAEERLDKDDSYLNCLGDEFFGSRLSCLEDATA